MMQESRENEAYKSIPLKTRLVIRLTVFLVKILYKMLLPLGFSPYFAISEIDYEVEVDLEEEELLQ